MTRKSIDTLRASWPPDPVKSEIIAMIKLIELHKQYPDIALRGMNISTAEGI